MDNNLLITLNLTLEEVNFIGNVLNELPTKTGAWMLVSKINVQVQAQLPVSEITETTTEVTQEESK
jgi:hypothetical protein